MRVICEAWSGKRLTFREEDEVLIVLGRRFRVLESTVENGQARITMEELPR